MEVQSRLQSSMELNYASDPSKGDRRFLNGKKQGRERWHWTLEK